MGLLSPNDQPSNGLLVAPEQAGYDIPTTPLGTMRDFLRFSMDRIYAPLMDHFNRSAMTPEQHQAAMSDPAFAEAARNWANYMNYYRNVVAP